MWGERAREKESDEERGRESGRERQGGMEGGNVRGIYGVSPCQKIT